MFKRKRAQVIVALAALGAGAVIALSLSAANPASAEVAKSGILLGALFGANEVNAAGGKGVGDPDGKGAASAVIDDGTICVGLSVRNIDAPVAAHIHVGAEGTNGPVVVPLTPPSAGDPGGSSTCAAIDANLASKIIRNPELYYWNVHTAAFPGGAIRGQLFTKSND